MNESTRKETDKLDVVFLAGVPHLAKNREAQTCLLSGQVPGKGFHFSATIAENHTRLFFNFLSRD